MSNIPQQFSDSKQQLENGKVTRFQLFAGEQSLSFREVIEFWQVDDSFRLFFNTLLRDSPYQAFRWETP